VSRGTAQAIRHRLPAPAKRAGRRALGLLGRGHVPATEHWIRKVLLEDTERELRALHPPASSAAEISGETWAGLGWRSYEQLSYPAFDLCAPADTLPGPFDVVICEQVLEHVVDPLTAVQSLRRLCAPGGHVLVSTPFLIRLHDAPGDYWRYTPDGLSRLLSSQGLEPLWVRSWGNRRCLKANLDSWRRYRPWHSLRNEPDLPLVVWALARPRAG